MRSKEASEVGAPRQALTSLTKQSFASMRIQAFFGNSISAVAKYIGKKKTIEGHMTLKLPIRFSIGQHYLRTLHVIVGELVLTNRSHGLDLNIGNQFGIRNHRHHRNMAIQQLEQRQANPWRAQNNRHPPIGLLNIG